MRDMDYCECCGERWVDMVGGVASTCVACDQRLCDECIIECSNCGDLLCNDCKDQVVVDGEDSTARCFSCDGDYYE